LPKAGFLHSYQGDINYLKNTLRDSYDYADGFPVIKEVIQNVEDAGAETLHMGWAVGLTSADNPLLRDPAVFFINDRNLSGDDARSLRSIGVSVKARDERSIGKFGLGLKSIFHLGEVVFYLSHQGLVLPNPQAPPNGVLNPWSSDDVEAPHPDWDEFSSDDQDALRSHLSALLTTPEWFCLYVPLRRSEHHRQCSPITSRDFGTGEGPMARFSAAHLPFSLAGLLPMLRSLSCVQGWQLHEPGATPERQFSVELGEGSTRSGFDGSKTAVGTRGLEGNVTVSRGGGAPVVCRFAGVERFEQVPLLAQLPECGLWPHSMVANSDEPQPEKCFPHAAAYALMTPDGGRAQMSMWRSVFLPLGQVEDQVDIEGLAPIHFFLHGYWFVDAGRQAVNVGEPESSIDQFSSEADVRNCWNSVVEDQLLMPLLPSALAAVAENGVSDEEQMAAITRVLEKRVLREGKRDQVCAEWQWVYVLRPGGGAWCRIEAARDLCSIPEPEDAGMHESALPGLREMMTRRDIVFHGAPSLTASGQPVKLSAEDVALLLEEPSVSPGPEFAHVHYAYALLAHCLGQKTDAGVSEMLEGALRNWIAGWAVAADATDDDTHSVFASVIRYVSAGRRVALLPGTSKLNHQWLSSLIRSTEGVLLVPPELRPAEPTSDVHLTSDVSAGILHMVGQRIALAEGQEAIALQKLVAHILELSEDREATLAGCSEVPLFDAHVLSDGDGDPQILSYSELTTAFEQGLLFTPDSADVSTALACSMADAQVVILDRRRIADLVFEQDALRHCDPAGAAHLLSRGLALSAPKERVELLRALASELPHSDGVPLVRAIRYLLHGQPDAIDSVDLKLYAHTPGGSAWTRVAEIAAERDGCLFANAGLAAEIPESIWQLIGLHEATNKTVCGLIEEVGPASFQGDRFTERQLGELLSLDEPELTRSMPIHRDLAGDWVAIDERSYWAGGFSPQEELPPTVTLLRQSEDPVTHAQQEKLAGQLAPEDAIEVCLAEAAPGKYWGLIVEALSMARDVDEDLRHRLETSEWLPAGDGRSLAPGRVLTHNRLSDDVLRVASGTDQTFACEEELSDQVTGSGHYEAVKKLFASGSTAIAVVADLLSELEEHRLGVTTHECGDGLSPEQVQCLTDALSGGPPGLEATCEVLGAASPAVVSKLSGRFCREVHIDRLAEIVDVLQNHCAAGRWKSDGVLRSVFCLYMRRLANCDPDRRVLQSLHLPNVGGEWIPSTALCRYGQGVPPAHVLNEEVADCLGTPPLEASHGQASPRAEKSGEAHCVLRDYFRDWDHYDVPRPLIGALLGAMGDQPGVAALASEYLQAGQIEWLRSELGLKHGHLSIEEVMRQQRVEVFLLGGDKVLLTSVAGPRFEADWHGHLEHIFVPTGQKILEFLAKRRGYRVTRLQLQRLELKALSREQLILLLRASFECILAEMFGSYILEASEEVRVWWEECGRADQVDIRVAQRRIAQALPLYARQLGLNRSREFGSLISSLESADRQWCEADLTESPSDEKKRKDHDARLKRLKREALGAQKELIAAVRRDGSVQAELLAAVRERVLRYQYSPASVPFELLQNADDAAVELEAIVGSEPPVPADEFVVAQLPGTLQFLHRGRRINQYAFGTRDRRSQGYDADLEKMLTLTSSDKGIGDDDPEVTGKFGLGFKTVLLVSDRPRVLSGGLGFEVVGGLWPLPLDEVARAALADVRDELGEDWRSGTIIELPLDRTSAHDVLAAFTNLIHIQLAFSRRIKACHFRLDVLDRRVSWQPHPVLDISGISTGRLQPVDGKPQRAVVFEEDSGEGSLLLGLSEDGFDSLADDVPAIWVTAPTRQPTGLGVALNGSFDIDVGRAQVSQERGNDELAARTAVSFGDLLCALFDAAATPGGWDALRADLGMVEEVQSDQFWASLWQVCRDAVVGLSDTSDGSAAGLVRTALWGARGGPSGGVIKLYETRPAMPSGLHGSQPKLVSVARLRWRVDTAVADVLDCVADWPAVAAEVPTGSVVSREVWGLLRDLGVSAVDEVTELTFDQVVAWEVAATSGRIEPEHAVRLGSVVDRELLAELDRHSSAEAGELRELLKKMEFRTQTGVFSGAAELVIAHVDEADVWDPRVQEEELSRAAFAPDANVLSDAYTGDALRFFLACRHAMRADATTLADWVRQADGSAKRTAALRYLAHGDLQIEVAARLRSKGVEGEWLDPTGTDFKEVVDELEPGDGNVLLGRLAPSDAWDVQMEPQSTIHPYPSTDDTDVLLQRIRDWWREEGTVRTERYLRTVWGDGEPRISQEDSMIDTRSRGEWLKLFLMGMFHRLGRTRPGQHRAFLQLFEQNGWLELVANTETRPEEWVRFLDDYIRTENVAPDYYQWMSQFVGMRWLALHLDDYFEGIRAMERHREPTPDMVVSQRTSASLQGTGFASPSLQKVLGIGQYFVFRELARMGLIHNTAFHKHCFVPAKRVRCLLSRLGCDTISPERWDSGTSQAIHGFLCEHIGEDEATFGEGFDIPFQCICDDVELQIELLQAPLEGVAGEDGWEE